MNIRGKKVLVTGSCGFIGSHLVEKLIDEGAKVRAFVLYNSFNSWGWLDSLPKDILNRIEVFAGDIRDHNAARSAIKDIDVVFHLAALIGIPFSYSTPDSYVDTNVKGTLNILQASRDARVKKVLVTSTSEVYGTALYVPIDEKHPRQAQSPYSATKIAADSLAESFYRGFSLPVTIVRPFNTYGPRQSARAIIPTIITQLLSGKSVIELGDIKPTRDLLYVKDTVEAFVRIAESDKTVGEEINVATGKEISVKDLAGKLVSIINPKAHITKDRNRMRPKNSEVYRLLGSNRKLKTLTRWRSAYSIDEGLKETVDWFKDKENLKLYKHDIYNV